MATDKLKLLEAQLEMEMAARFSAERLLQLKEAEILQLKKEQKAPGKNEAILSQKNIIDTISNHLQTGFLIENESGLVVAANQAFCNYFDIKRTPESLSGIDLDQEQLILPELFKNHYLYLLNTNEILDERKAVMNDVIELKNGIVLERDYIPIFQEEEYKGHIWYYRNTTDKSILEKKLETQKILYESILSKMPADIAVFNPEHAELFLNPVAIKDTELRKWVIEWMIGKQKEDDIYVESWGNPQNYQELFNQIIQKKETGAIEEIRLNEAGEETHFLRTLFPVLDEAGEINMIIGYNTDITDRVRAEQKLVEAQKITEEAIKAKEIFLANMSHEIRTPMNGILGLAHLLEKTPLSAQQQKLVQLINASSNNLLVVVNDILNIEKIASGKLELEKVPFLIADKIAITIESFQYKAEEKGIQLELNNLTDKHTVLIGDPYRLSQVLNNLVGNAIKFTDKGAVIVSVTILPSTEKSDLSFVKPEDASSDDLPEKSFDRASGPSSDLSSDRLSDQSSAKKCIIRISVKDSGIGIDPDKLEEIFIPFKQAASAITRKYGGTGLGLSICKNLIELQGGSIRVESAPAKGSVFSFDIPYEIGSLKMLQTEQPIISNFEQISGKRILLAEDLELNQFIVESILQEKGAVVISVEDGQKAVEKLKTENFDIILMDILMPVMDGIEAAKIIRSSDDPQKANIPIIALTANALKGDEDIYKEAGMNGYISKPFKEAVLLQTIVNALNYSPGQSTELIVDFPESGSDSNPDSGAESGPESGPENEPNQPAPTEIATTEKLYDDQLLREMGKGNTAFIHKMVHLFLKTMPADIELLKQYTSDNNCEMVSKTAHRMKSAIDGMGIQALRATIREVETLGKTATDIDPIHGLVNHITGILTEVMQQLQRDYPE